MKKDAKFKKGSPLPHRTLLLVMALGSVSAVIAPSVRAEAPRTPSPSQVLIRDEQSRKLAEEIEILEAQNARSRSPVLTERIALKKMGLAKLEQGTEVLVQELLAHELEEVLSETSKSAPLLAGAEVPDQMEKPAQAELDPSRPAADVSGQTALPRAGLAVHGK